MKDKAGDNNNYRFGSAHPGGWQAVFCDGSVHTLSYTIDLTVHRRLANRRDGEVISGSQF